MDSLGTATSPRTEPEEAPAIAQLCRRAELEKRVLKLGRALDFSAPSHSLNIRASANAVFVVHGSRFGHSCIFAKAAPAPKNSREIAAGIDFAPWPIDKPALPDQFTR